MTTDYISRTSVSKSIRNWRDNLIMSFGEDDDYVRCLGLVDEFILEYRPANVRQVRRGHWINPNQYGLICSECGTYIWNLWKFDYCPGCGADMRDDDDREENREIEDHDLKGRTGDR